MLLRETEQADEVGTPSGAARGRTEDGPPAKSFVEDDSEGWSIGKPDLIVDLPEPFFVKDEVEDLNISLVTQLTDQELAHDTWVKAIEFRGGSTMVHHICGYALAPKDRTDELEALTRNRLGCIAPGAESRTLPEGHAIFLPKGARIAFGMHYVLRHQVHGDDRDRDQPTRDPSRTTRASHCCSPKPPTPGCAVSGGYVRQAQASLQRAFQASRKRPPHCRPTRSSAHLPLPNSLDF